MLGYLLMISAICGRGSEIRFPFRSSTRSLVKDAVFGVAKEREGEEWEKIKE